MAARGAYSKEVIVNKILEVFPEAFWVDAKELRIPIDENGEEVQIKVALTAAKVNIERANSDNKPAVSAKTSAFELTTDRALTKKKVEPTEEEKDTLRRFLANI